MSNLVVALHRAPASFYTCLMTTLSAFIIFVPDPAVAACVNTTGNHYECSGTNNTYLTMPDLVDADIVTVPGFNVTTTSGDALNIRLTQGSLTYTDLSAAHLKSSYNALNIRVSDADIDDVNVIIGEGSVYETTQPDWYRAINLDNYYGKGTTNFSFDGQAIGRIYVTAGPTSTGMDVNLGEHSSAGALSFNQYGDGDLDVTIDGHVDAASTAVNLQRTSRGAGSLIVNQGSTSQIISQGGTAIYANHYGQGDLRIKADGYAEATAGGFAAVYGYNDGSGATYIEVNGSAQADTGSAVYLSSQNNTTSATIITGDNSNIQALGTNGRGVYVSHQGSGALTMNLGGHIESYGAAVNASAGYGAVNVMVNGNAISHHDTALYLHGNEKSAGMSLTTGQNSNITSGSAYSAIYAGYYGAGDMTLNIGGQVTGGLYGLYAYYGSTSYGSSLSVGTLGIDIRGHLSGKTGISLSNRGVVNEGHVTLHSGGSITGTDGTAIIYETASIIATKINILGGRIIGDVVDNRANLGYSPVTVSGNFTSEGNFLVSSFDVAPTGYFRIGADNVIDSLADVNVYGTFETAGTNGRIERNTHVHQGGILRVADNHVLNNGAVFTNSGTLSLGAGSVFKTDTMATGTSGILSFDVASKTSHGLLEILNGPADLTNQDITFRVTGSGGLADKDMFKIIDGQGAVIGGPKGTWTLASSSVLWDFEIADGTLGGTDDSDIFVLAHKKAQAQQLVTTPNNGNAAESLTGLQGTTNNPQLLAIIDNVNNAATAEELNQILESVQATIDSGDSRIAANQMMRIQGMANLRLENLRFSNASTVLGRMGYSQDSGQINDRGVVWASSFGEDALPSETDLVGQRAWAGLSGQYGRQRAKNGISGYKSRSNGLAFGVDSGHSFNHFVIGAAVGIGKMRLRSDNANRAINKVDSYQTTLYGEHRLPRNSYVNASVSYAIAKNDTQRYDVGGVQGLTASGEFDARQYGASASVGHHMVLGKYILTPSFHTDWVRYKADDYTETGAGGAGLHVQSKSVDLLESGIRMKLRREFITAEKNSIIPEIRTGYRYDFIGDNMRKDLQFVGGGSAFSIDSPNPARHKFNFGVGVVYRTKGSVDFAVHYDTEVEKKYQSHAVSARATYKF